tara:strand:- start:1319 stop:2128 length:810 start_codon:yes stop_codon:yes gene_type:complete
MSQFSTYEYINFDKGILDNIIDAVYVITLEKSDRLTSVYTQLNDFKLCKTNIIRINKRYNEHYNPSLYTQNSMSHLLYNNIQIFKHSNKYNYNNILILEDDFIFDASIKNQSIINHFEDFISKNKNFNLIYLGNVPLIINPFSYDYFINVYFNGQAHSIIYSKKARNIIYDNYKNKNYTWIQLHDIWYNFILNERYYYYKNICYQVFSDTENKDLWTNPFLDLLIKSLKLDEYNIDNYNYYYKYILILHYIIIIIIIITIIYIINMYIY